MATRTKEGFDNWKLLHIFVYGNDIKSWINKDNYTDSYLNDWYIMEVVEKVWDIQEGKEGDTIRNHPYNVEISHLYCCITIGGDLIIEKSGETTQQAVYDAMVEFVNYYNHSSIIPIKNEEDETIFSKEENLFWEYNKSDSSTIFLFDKAKELGCYKVFLDEELDKREYIVLNDTVYYLDTLNSN